MYIFYYYIYIRSDGVSISYYYIYINLREEVNLIHNQFIKLVM